MLSFDAHVNSVCKAVNYHAKALRHIQKRITTDIALTIVSTMVVTRLDYCNAILHGTSKSIIQKLQRAQNSELYGLHYNWHEEENTSHL